MENSCKTDKKPKNLKEFIKSKNFLRPLVGILVGGIAGFMYYYLVGCSSGTCSITSSPYASIGWGSMLGLFITNSPCRNC
jgi:hypothetical protein